MIKKLVKNNFSEVRCVVTGLGAVTSLGNNMSEIWENITAGKSGVIDLKDENYYSMLPKYYKVGAPISKTFQRQKYKTLGTDNLCSQITMSAADEAILDSGLAELLMKKEINPFKVGVITGTSAPSLNCIVSNSFKACEKNDFNQIDRMGMLKVLTNLLNYNISSKYGLKGITNSISLSCASGLNAIGEGVKSIKSGEVSFFNTY